MKLHLDTAGGIAFFAGTARSTLQSGTSLYRSNVHAANFGARFAITKRADLYVGVYDHEGHGRRPRDGDGRCDGPDGGTLRGSADVPADLSVAVGAG